MNGPGSPEVTSAASPSVRATAAFFTAIPSFRDFDGIGDPDVFRPLPDDWRIGLADVVASRAAIAAGKYKNVNTAGASVISAVSNALGTLDFPFIFGGDGASFAVAPEDAAAAAEALAATVAWVGGELGLGLRGGMMAVREIRSRQLDVRVARFAASGDIAYSMFAGGGLAWAEERLKAGELTLAPAPPGARPDLSGLSCRFQDLKTKHGVILSVLVRPTGRADDPRFRAIVADVLAEVEDGPDSGRPIPVFRPLGGVRFASIGANARLDRKPGQSWAGSVIRSGVMSVVAAVTLGLGADIGNFSARKYLREVVANSDFRKYDDGLMMTLDCTPDFAESLDQRLAHAEAEGVAYYGLHRQTSATITCVVPSYTQSNHVHFIDGAAGGYAMAADNLRRGRERVRLRRIRSRL